jgi:hypothetical protein
MFRVLCICEWSVSFVFLGILRSCVMFFGRKCFVDCCGNVSCFEGIFCLVCVMAHVGMI